MLLHSQSAEDMLSSVQARILSVFPSAWQSLDHSFLCSPVCFVLCCLFHVYVFVCFCFCFSSKYLFLSQRRLESLPGTTPKLNRMWRHKCQEYGITPPLIKLICITSGDVYLLPAKCQKLCNYTYFLGLLRLLEEEITLWNLGLCLRQQRMCSKEEELCLNHRPVHLRVDLT